MSTFVVLTFLLLVLRLGAAAAVIKHLPGIRNGAAFLVALLSAYVFSIASDNILGPLVGDADGRFVPIVAGIVYGLGFYSIARKLVTKPNAARAAYFLIGVLGIIAGFVGHRQNFFVGASLLLLCLVLPFDSHVKSRPVSLARN